MQKLFVSLALIVVCALLAGNPRTSSTKAATPTAASDKAAIEALEQRYVKAFNAKDVNAIMENYAPGDQLFVFDAVPPRNIQAGKPTRRTGRAFSLLIPVRCRMPSPI